MSYAVDDDTIKKSNIVFIDDQIKDLRNYIDQLYREGYKSIQQFDNPKSLSEIVQTKPVLVILDLEGVAVDLDPENQGIAVLEYLKKHCPFTKVFIFSGHELDVSQSEKVEIADKKIKKGAISLKDFVCIVEDLISDYYDPFTQKEILVKLFEKGNMLEKVIEKQGVLKKRKLRKILLELQKDSQQISADQIFASLKNMNVILKDNKEIVGLITLFLKICLT